MVEGTVTRVRDHARLEHLVALWKSRLNWDFHATGEGFDGALVYAVHRTKVLAVGKGETYTRFRFPA